jgi:hypothetical protein
MTETRICGEPLGPREAAWVVSGVWQVLGAAIMGLQQLMRTLEDADAAAVRPACIITSDSTVT